MRKKHPPSPTLVALLGEILKRAREVHGWTGAELAARVNIRPELLSRMRTRGTGDFSVLEALAREVGLRLTLAPADSLLDRIRRGEYLP